MVRIGMDAAALSRWAAAQRLGALKRIISREHVTQALRRPGGRRRCTRLPDTLMVWLVIAMGLLAQSSCRQTLRQLTRWKKAAIPLRSTLCEARQRLGVLPLVQLAETVVQLLATAATPGAFWRGYRLLAIDGFVVDLPDTPANERAFDRPRNGKRCGAFPQAQVMGLVECGTHVFWRWLIRPCHAAETKMALPLLRHLQPGMLLLWDRGFTAFELLQQVQGQGAQLLAKWKRNRILLPIRHFSDGSYLAKAYACDKDRRHDRNGILVRVIEYSLRSQSGSVQPHRLLTTLLDAQQYPARELIELYHLRWEEELAIDELKTHQQGRPVLRSQRPDGVVQELYGLLLGHYVVRVLMHEAARQQQVAPLRVSFTATLQILRCRLGEVPPGRRARQNWWRRLIAEIGEELLPPRRRRCNPRVIKRQQSQWPTKRPTHRNPPQPQGPFLDSVEVLR